MITPIEIRQQSFRRVLRGYDSEEVKGFLDTLAQEWEKRIETERRLRAELEQVKANYNSLKEVESMLHKTLIQAEKSSKTTVENARKKAELQIKEAEAKAREIVRQGVDERNKLDSEITELTARKEQILMQLRLFLKTQSERLQAFERQKDFTQIFSTTKADDKAAKDVFDVSTENGEAATNLLDDIVEEL